MRVRGRWLAVLALALIAGVALTLWLARSPSRSQHGAQATWGRPGGARIWQGGGLAGPDHSSGGRPIAGIVVDHGGTPLAGATVRLASKRLSALTTPTPTTTTSAGGTFDLGTQPLETVIVSAELAGMTATLAEVDLTDPLATPAPDKLRLILHPCNAAIHGTVYDMAEGTIAGATLALVTSGVQTGAAATSDANGAFDLCVPAGDATIIVAADGYAPATEEIAVTGRTQRDFELAPGAVVTGHAVRASDHAPVAGARVELTGSDPTSDEVPLVTIAGPDGRFEIAGATPGVHFVRATADHLVAVEPTEVMAEVGVAKDVTVELQGASTVSGRVVAPGVRSPVGGVRVSLLDASRFGFARVTTRGATSQLDGSFVVENIPDGTYRAILDSTGSGEPIVVKGADITGLVLELEPSATVSGRTLAEGKPIDGVAVRIGHWSTTSDTDGRYTVRGIEVGTHDVYAQCDRIGAFTRDGEVTVAAGETKTGVDISLDMAGSIEGVVTDQDGAPVPGALVWFSLLHGEDVGSATTADDGSFRAGALSGGGDYVYEVHLRNEAGLLLPPLTGKRFPPVAVKDGKTHVTGLRVRVRHERLAITGRVVDENGKPVSDASVRGIPLGEGLYRVPKTMTSENGSFTLRELSPGGYLLTATGAHAEGKLADVPAGTRDVVIRAAAFGGIDGTLTSFKRAPLVSAIRRGNSFERHPATVTGATFSVRDLPVGHYSVVARVGGEVSRVGVDVSAGAIAKVTVGPAEYGSISGTVVAATTRTPLPRMGCRATGATDGEPDDTGMTSETIVYSDAAGYFVLDHVLVGEVVVVCTSHGRVAWATSTVAAGRATTVELSADEPSADEKRPDAGITLENQLADVVVDSVEPGGPAAKAGVRPGDVLVRVDEDAITRFMAAAALAMIEDEPGTVTLVLERDDKQLTVTLNLPPP